MVAGRQAKCTARTHAHTRKRVHSLSVTEKILEAQSIFIPGVGDWGEEENFRLKPWYFHPSQFYFIPFTNSFQQWNKPKLVEYHTFLKIILEKKKKSQKSRHNLFKPYLNGENCEEWHQKGFWNFPWTHTLCMLFPFRRFVDLTQQYSSSSCKVCINISRQ